MDKDEYKENSLLDQIYTLSTRSRISWIALCLFLFFLGLALNFPLGQVLESRLRKVIAQQRQCPLRFSQLELGPFWPKATLKNIQIGKRCLGRGPISLQEVALSFLGPSLSPLGAKLALTPQLPNSQLELVANVGAKSAEVRIDPISFNLKDLSLLKIPLSLEGVIKGTALVTLKIGGRAGVLPHTAHLRLTSNDLFFPAQTIQIPLPNTPTAIPYPIPALSFQKLNLLAQLKRGKVLEIKNFVLGNENSALTAQLQGNITLNQGNIGESVLDLKGEVKFGEQIKQISGIKLLLNQLPQQGGVYQINLTGTLSTPHLK